MWIFWVHCSTRSRFTQSFDGIARKLKLPISSEGSRQSTLQMVTDWLRDEANGRWVLVLDSCDDLEVLNGTSSDASSKAVSSFDGLDLLTYVPQVNHGKVLISTRNREVAYNLTNDEDCLIHVPPMSRIEGMELLRSKLPKDKSPEYDMIELAEELDFLPLAIKQAAAYISSTNTSLTITKYLQRFRNNEAIQRRFLLKAFNDLSRDKDLKNSIILTLQMSLDQIRARSPAAADLLAIMSYYDRQSIPERLLLNGNANELAIEVFEESMTTLQNFSLVAKVEVNSFSMHRLVQLTM